MPETVAITVAKTATVKGGGTIATGTAEEGEGFEEEACLRCVPVQLRL